MSIRWAGANSKVRSGREEVTNGEESLVKRQLPRDGTAKVHGI